MIIIHLNINIHRRNLSFVRIQFESKNIVHQKCLDFKQEAIWNNLHFSCSNQTLWTLMPLNLDIRRVRGKMRIHKKDLLYMVKSQGDFKARCRDYEPGTGDFCVKTSLFSLIPFLQNLRVLLFLSINPAISHLLK